MNASNTRWNGSTQTISGTVTTNTYNRLGLLAATSNWRSNNTYTYDINGALKRDLIKRIVAIPGDTIEYRSCVLYINGTSLTEPYLDPEVVTSTRCGPDQSTTMVPDHHVFVLGDNRGGSKDSRDVRVGPVAYDDIIGRAFVIVWPASDWAWL